MLLMKRELRGVNKTPFLSACKSPDERKEAQASAQGIA
jgi:hypothetical protein